MLHLINGYLPWEDAYNLLHPHDEDALQTNSYLHGEDAYNLPHLHGEDAYNLLRPHEEDAKIFFFFMALVPCQSSTILVTTH